MSTIGNEIHRELTRLHRDGIRIEYVSLSHMGHAELIHSADSRACFRHETGEKPDFLGVELIVDASQQERFIVQKRGRQN